MCASARALATVPGGAFDSGALYSEEDAARTVERFTAAVAALEGLQSSVPDDYTADVEAALAQVRPNLTAAEEALAAMRAFEEGNHHLPDFDDEFSDHRDRIVHLLTEECGIEEWSD